MFRVIKTSTFDSWLNVLADRRARAAILARIDRMRLGNLGDNKSLGDGLHEARLFCGPGYRLYYLREGNTLIVLLTGGDKGSQTQDIRNARQLARAWRQETED